MARRNIVTTGDEVLTKMCRPVEKFDAKLWTLLDDMYAVSYTHLDVYKRQMLLCIINDVANAMC